MMINFRIISVRQLPEFVESEFFSGLSEIPVSKHRALSLAANPRASADDPALILALDEKEILLGYWGFFSDHLKGNPNEIVLWNSGWRMLPDASHAAMPLLYKALQICGNRIFFSDLTPHTKQILEATGKVTVQTREGQRWYFRSCSYDLTPRRNLFYKILNPFYFFLDFDINFLFASFVRKTRIPDGFKCTDVPSFNNDDQEFIRTAGIPSLTCRSITELNWIKNNPWIIPVEKDDPVNKKRYYFTSSEKHFQVRFYRIQKDDRTVALAMLNNRNGHITIPYFICLPGNEKDSAAAILNIISGFRPKTFTTFNTLFMNSCAQPGCLYKKTVLRYFAWGNKTPFTYSSDILIQDGDGDCAFT